MRGLLFLIVVGLLLPGVSAASHSTLLCSPTPEEMVAQGAIFRLVSLPDGAAAPAVRVSDPAGRPLGSDAVTVETLDPMIMRGRRFLPVILRPAEGTRPVEYRLELAWDEAAASGHPIASRASGPNVAAKAAARGFHDTVRPLVLGAEKELFEAEREGGYLIITAPEFLETVRPLAEWKREKGLDVRLVTTAETGVDRNQIRAYIGNLYETAEVPPQFVLLVGDIELVPAFDFHGVVSDLPFALQEGDDFLPDLDVGRLSARDLSQAQTMVAKILRHERDPYRGDAGNGAWMGRGLVVGADYASTTPREVSRWVRRTMLDLGWAQVDSVYFPPHHGSGTPLISARVNAGVSLLTYRGWAYGPQGWDRPTFLNNHVAGLNNTWMLPVVMSFVCLNNKFDEPECFGESWVRAGTADAPKGAVAFIGNGEHWSHTRFNDAAAIGALASVDQGGIRRLGDILNAVKLNILQQFPLEIPYESEAGESVEFYYYIYNLLGDPEMSLWTGPPIDLLVDGPSDLTTGSNLLEMTIRSAAAAEPLAGVRVAVTRGGVLLANGWTSEAGTISLPIAPLAAGDPVRVTITGANAQPQLLSLPVVDRDRLAVTAVTARDDNGDGSLGNGDGAANPGERLALRLTLRNDGAGALNDLSASLYRAEDPENPLAPGTIAIPALGAGETQTTSTPFLVPIPVGAEDGFVPSYRLRVLRAGSPFQVLELGLAVVGPSLQIAGQSLDVALVPGGTSTLHVTVANEGSRDAAEVQAVLRSVDAGLLAVADSADVYGTISADGSGAGTDGFVIRAADDAVAGSVANLRLELNSSAGGRSSLGLTVTIGVADATTPLGPDRYGYWIYDNTDTDYPAGAPLYDWVEISPNYGGPGTALVLDSNIIDVTDPNETQQVTLPFAFTYYGESHDALLVGDNGWASFDLRKGYDYYNWAIPGPYGNLARLCPFWDNLMPGKRDANGLVGDGVYSWYDEANHRFIIEWSRIGNTDQPGTPPNPSLFFDDLQTFQMILHDPEHLSTPTGDGVVEFQYKQILNIDTGRMYATVGMENAGGDDGLEYTFSNQYPPQAAPLNAGLALRITTQPARYVPFSLAAFRAERTPGGVALSWTPIDERPRGRTRVYRAEAGAPAVILNEGVLDASARRFVDRTADPHRSWTYWIGSEDPVGRETRTGPFLYDPSAAIGSGRGLDLSVVGANPFRERIDLAWSLPSAAEARISIFDVSGREVRMLNSGAVKALSGLLAWDGRDDQGLRLPAGTYWARLESGADARRVRLMLLR